MSTTPTLYALIGHDISYTLSPLIHNFIYRRLSVEAVYVAFDIEPRELKDTVEFLKRNAMGFNVTKPFKTEVIKFLDYTDPDAMLIDAVNTVKCSGGELLGFNTDAKAVLEALKELDTNISGSTASIIGAGGAAKAVLYALYKLGVSQIFVINRSKSRGEELVKKASMLSVDAEYIPPSNLDSVKRAVSRSVFVANCTPIGTLDLNATPIPAEAFHEQQVVLDMVYRPRLTRLLIEALNRGASIIDGFKILVYQAVKANEVWLEKDLKELLHATYNSLACVVDSIAGK